MIWAAVAMGGALGSLARHGTNVLFSHLLGRPGFYATATVNIAGRKTIARLLANITFRPFHCTPNSFCTSLNSV